MNNEFFERKIKKLSDDKLIDLLRLRSDANQPVIQLAMAESKRRNLEIEKTAPTSPSKIDRRNENKWKLKKWNWGAFLLAPFWTLANKLDAWFILCSIPFINIITIFYLGFNGNRLAYPKSSIDSVDDFMAVQRYWSIWGLSILSLSVITSIIWLFID